MKFLVYLEIEPENRDKGFERFKTSGEGNPDSVKTLSVWMSATLLEGWIFLEADDATALAETMKHWTDLNVNHITPVLDGDEFMKVIS